MNKDQFTDSLIDFILITRSAIYHNDMSPNSLAPWNPISGGEVLDDLMRRFEITEADIKQFVNENSDPREIPPPY